MIHNGRLGDGHEREALVDVLQKIDTLGEVDGALDDEGPRFDQHPPRRSVNPQPLALFWGAASDLPLDREWPR